MEDILTRGEKEREGDRMGGREGGGGEGRRKLSKESFTKIIEIQ